MTVTRSRALIVLIAFLAALAVIVVPAPQALAVAKIVCAPPVLRASIDPIVNHNQDVASEHQHVFFGNTKFASGNPPGETTRNGWERQQLIGQGTECLNPDDTALYWVPNLVYTSGANEGQSVPIRNVFAYYRTWRSMPSAPSTDPTEPHPKNVRLIAGDPHNTQPLTDRYPGVKIAWSCDDRSSRDGFYDDIVAANCDQATGTVFLTARIAFQTCWNGVMPQHNGTEVGDTRDNADWRYFTGSRDNASCPTGFGARKASELRLGVKWDYQGGGGNVALTSDIALRNQGTSVVSGRTLHGDFWNTWLQDANDAPNDPQPGFQPAQHGGYEAVVRDCVVAPAGHHDPIPKCDDGN